MDYIVREYLSKDRQRIVSFFEALQTWAATIDPIKRIRCMPGYGESAIKDEEESFEKYHGKSYVAEVDGEVVGHIWGLIATQSDENLLTVNPSKLGVVKEFYVEDKYRNQHIGSKLMDKLENYFKQSGCDTVWLQVFVPNQNAYSFYKHKGYLDRDLEMLKKI